MSREGPQVGVLHQDFKARRGRSLPLSSVLPWMAEWPESTTELALAEGGGKCMSPWKMMEESSRVLYLEAHDH